VRVLPAKRSEPGGAQLGAAVEEAQGQKVALRECDFSGRGREDWGSDWMAEVAGRESNAGAGFVEEQPPQKEQGK
jgi:hypothetical protein